MVNRSVLRSGKASASTEGTSSGGNLKRSRPASSSESEGEVQVVKRGPRISRRNDTSPQVTPRRSNLTRSRRANSSASESEDVVQIAKRHSGSCRKEATAAQGSSQVNSKNRRTFNYPESESEDELQESRPKRKFVRRVTYEESDYDFENSPITKKTGEGSKSQMKMKNSDSKKYALSLSKSESDTESVKRTSKNVCRKRDAAQTKSNIVDSKKHVFSSFSSAVDCSSSEPEFQFGDLALEEKTDNELAEEPVQETISKRKRTRKAKDENKRTRVKFSGEQVQVLQTLFCETQFSTKEERENLAEKTNLSIRQVEKWFVHKRNRNPEMVKSRPGRRQRDLNKPSGFEDAMGKFFEKRQFLEEPDEALELESGGSWKRLVGYLEERSLALKVLKYYRTKEVYLDQKEVVLADHHDVDYLNEPELDYQIYENQSDKAVE
ncbi:Protein CBG17526 [Caenorhabditis briggsae]|uniref:Protein CBG17526 n=1 Tax=Caenorhabditis briggsae TaxID=6238 RepID=A8XRD8_CAEBR|nr:Protein CBG17526 [Caenorhabditis briggsae]CAP35157.2 Protein CBG17526 [Caenorhabditis briggsae]